VTVAGSDGLFAAHHCLVGPGHMMFHPFVILARLAAEMTEGYWARPPYKAKLEALGAHYSNRMCAGHQ
jgi:hypothetical protein